MEHVPTSLGLQRIIADDAVGQLCDRRGRMAELADENGRVMLDWVDALGKLLDHPESLAAVEDTARALRDRGTRYVIWAGMGGSVMAVRVLAELVPPSDVMLLPLDSTDPVALDAVIATIAAAEGVALDALDEPDGLRRLLAHTAIVAVAMGRTSEEPMTHLGWYVDLLERADLAAADRVVVMAIPDSYLERFAHDRALPILPIQPDGGAGTGGRMSAPGTHVFLFPVVLRLLSGAREGPVAEVLRRAWEGHDLEGARRDPRSHPFVHLAATLSDLSADGALLVTLELPEPWQPVFPWVEQLIEESLGKGGKGIVLFEPQSGMPAGGLPHVHVVISPRREPRDDFALVVSLPWIAEPPDIESIARLFMGWQMCMALVGWLHDIQFAGQPAVEHYKARAREIRQSGAPLESVAAWRPRWEFEGARVLLPPSMEGAVREPLTVIRETARSATYLDITVNGELQDDDAQRLRDLARSSPAGVLTKLRRAPAAYHSTEQSEMDGPPGLLSLRVLSTAPRAVMAGSYDVTFLEAQAIGTWQAMLDAGRQCLLILTAGSPVPLLERLWEERDG